MGDGDRLVVILYYLHPVINSYEFIQTANSRALSSPTVCYCQSVTLSVTYSLINEVLPTKRALRTVFTNPPPH